MLSTMAAEDCDELTRQGARLSAAEIVRLNALGVRAECSPDAADFDALPRCCLLGNELFREPTIGHELWLQNAGRIFDRGDGITGFALRAFALATPLDKLPDWSSVEDMRRELDDFASRRLGQYTARQVIAAVNWCMVGNDWTIDELPETAKADKPEKPEEVEEAEGAADPEELRSIALGVVRESQALALGISLADAMNMTRSGLQAVVMRAYQLKGVEIDKQKRDVAIGDYMATLEKIKTKHAGELTNGE